MRTFLFKEVMTMRMIYGFIGFMFLIKFIEREGNKWVYLYGFIAAALVAFTVG